MHALQQSVLHHIVVTMSSGLTPNTGASRLATVRVRLTTNLECRLTTSTPGNGLIMFST